MGCLLLYSYLDRYPCWWKVSLCIVQCESGPIHLSLLSHGQDGWAVRCLPQQQEMWGSKLVSDSIPAKNSFGLVYKLMSSLCTHASHHTYSKDPDIHVLDGWMPATGIEARFVWSGGWNSSIGRVLGLLSCVMQHCGFHPPFLDNFMCCHTVKEVSS